MPLIGTFTSAGISKQATKCVVVRLTASDGTVGISSIEPSAVTKSPGTAAELAVAHPGSRCTCDCRAGSDQHQPLDRVAGRADAHAARRRSRRGNGVRRARVAHPGRAALHLPRRRCPDERAIQRLDRAASARGSGGGSAALAQSGVPLGKDQSRQRCRSRPRPHRSSSRSGRQRDEASHRRQLAVRRRHVVETLPHGQAVRPAAFRAAGAASTISRDWRGFAGKAAFP